MTTEVVRCCLSCRCRRPIEQMEKKRARNGAEGWYCPDCPRRRGERPNKTIDAGSLLGRYRVLARRPCVATEADLGKITLGDRTIFCS